MNTSKFPRGIFIAMALIALACLPVMAQDLKHVEPPFWWAGMKNTNLELLVHGDNVATTTPFIDYQGVTIHRVTVLESPNYAFVQLKISPEVKPGAFEIEFRRGRKKVSSYTYELKQRREGSAERVGFNNSDVIYLITPDRFVNGDPSNDTHPDLYEGIDRSNIGGRHGGDIKGIVDQMDYLSDLGFTGIWLNPILENNMEEYSYHGYSTTDFYRVDPRFGSNEEYVEMSRIGKQKGMKMIMDMIVNHCGSNHWWMADPPSSDWTNFDNTYVQTNHSKPAIQDPYGSDYDLKHFVDGWFVETMPDMNQRNLQMANYLIQNAIWWIEYADLDGIRMDTWPYSDKDFLTRWACEIMAEYPNFNITGEEWNGNPNILAYWQQGKVNHDGYISCLPSLLDFPIQESMRKGFTGNEDIVELYEMLANDYIYANPNVFVTFPDNHDMDRIFTQVGEDYGKFKNAIAYVLTTRGTPQIYYGTELLFTNEDPGNHGQIRKDYPGGWEEDEVNAFTGQGLTQQQKDAREFIKKLNNWRQTNSTVHFGAIKHFRPYDKAYIFFRMDEKDMVMVVINMNKEEREIDISRLAEVLEGAPAGTDIISGADITFGNKLTLPADSPMIIEIKNFTPSVKN